MPFVWNIAGEDIRKLDSGVHVVSGTPGRVFDMIQRRNLRTRHIKTLILDEADEMLAKNFKDQIYDIYRCVGSHAFLCSSTILEGHPPPNGHVIYILKLLKLA